MDPNPIRNDARKAQRGRSLGAHAACALCGYANPEALIRVRRSLLEHHHVCAKANDPELTVVLCRNCHAEVTEGQRVAGVRFGAPATVLHQFTAALASLAVFVWALGGRFADWATAFTAFIARLDQELPSWRSWPEAQPWRGAL